MSDKVIKFKLEKGLSSDEIKSLEIGSGVSRKDIIKISDSLIRKGSFVKSVTIGFSLSGLNITGLFGDRDVSFALTDITKYHEFVGGIGAVSLRCSQIEKLGVYDVVASSLTDTFILEKLIITLTSASKISYSPKNVYQNWKSGGIMVHGSSVTYFGNDIINGKYNENDKLTLAEKKLLDKTREYLLDNHMSPVREAYKYINGLNSLLHNPKLLKSFVGEDYSEQEYD